MEHAQMAARASRPKPSATRRGYGSEWQAVRREVLVREPACRSCGGIATEVDHIVPLRLGGTHALSNLQPLCRRCHAKKTAAQASTSRFGHRALSQG